MAFPVLTLPPFPNVPQAPGVPALARSALFPPTPTPPALDADAAAVASTSSAPKWGIFDSFGVPVVTFDSFVSIEYMGEMRVSDFPLEQGAFETYNKVAVPFEARVTVSKGGSSADRTTFLNQCEAAKVSLDLFSVFTPDRAYKSVNVEAVDYARKSDKGVTMILANFRLIEVRVTVTPQYSNTAAPSGAGAQSGGTVQATPPTSDQSSAAAGGAG